MLFSEVFLKYQKWKDNSKTDLRNKLYVVNKANLVHKSDYALHILNYRHEYGTISDTTSLLKHINKS
jgi:hypothetical protein